MPELLMPTREPPKWRRRVRLGLESALERTGLAAAWGGLVGHRGAIVLSYHSVPSAELAPWIDPEYAIPKDVFAAHTRFLARHCNVLSLDELIPLIAERRPMPARTVAITLDDGYLDNLTVAADILDDARLPATCFLATRYVAECAPQWIDRLYGMFAHRTRHELDLRGQGLARWLLTSQDAVNAAYRGIASRLLPAGWDERQAILCAIEGQLVAAGERPRTTMTWDDARQFAAGDRFTVGGHTSDHVDLTAHRDEARDQVGRCRADIREHLGLEARHFTYPYGRFDAELGAVVRECGFESALTTEAVAMGSDVDVTAVPRADAPADPSAFRFVSTGLVHLFRKYA